MIYTNIHILESNAWHPKSKQLIVSYEKSILWIRWARNGMINWISICMYFCCCSIDSWKEVKLADGPQRQRHTTFFGNPYQNLLKAHSTTKTACLDFDIPIFTLAHISHPCANFTNKVIQKKSKRSKIRIHTFFGMNWVWTSVVTSSLSKWFTI